MTNSFYELAEPGVVSEKFQEGLVILNMDSGLYFDAGERLVPLLEALFSGISADALKSGLEKLEVGAGEQMSTVVTQLLEYGLIRNADSGSHEVSEDILNSILGGGTDYHLESHGDLAELIAADPVHDVDPETGRLKT